MERKSRKLDHLKYALQLEDGPASNGFSDINLVHNCLPELSWHDIDISSVIAGIPLVHPVIINAITGGIDDVTAINAELAEFACITGSAMAVGSQYAALECQEVQDSYKIVRKVNPNGVLLANLGAHTTPTQAKRAVEMIEANAIQIHLNAAQEIIMAEGDRDFSGYLDNIADIAAKVEVPVIVKEVGCGIAREQAAALISAGVRAIDVGGIGGTNFMAIEAARNQSFLPKETLNWGIPTAISTIEVASILPEGVDLMVSGGIRTPLDVVKSLALGGAAVGMAAPIIRVIHESGLEAAIEWFKSFVENLKRYMLLQGVRRISELNEVPVVITGYSKEWLTARGIDIAQYGSHRKKKNQ